MLLPKGTETFPKSNELTFVDEVEYPYFRLMGTVSTGLTALQHRQDNAP